METICQFPACGLPIPIARLKWKNTKFCCGDHQIANANARWGITNRPKLNLASGTVGAIAEYLVGIDLLKQGYEVFRALSPNCSCDLAVLKNGALKPIEVRSGIILVNGKVCWPKKGIRASTTAVVIYGEPVSTIVYFPPLEP